VGARRSQSRSRTKTSRRRPTAEPDVDVTRAHVVAAFAVVVAACGRPAGVPVTGPSGSAPLAFVGVNVVAMTADAENDRQDQTVLVQDGRIKAIGARGSVDVPAGALEIDGRRQVPQPLAPRHFR